jgi:DNA-binding response OmpR family regulator
MTRVLIVDDEPAVRAALDRALRLDGYEITLAADGREALDRLADTRHDAVVLDVAMPGIDGLQVCRRLRDAGDRTPVLMLTARDAVDDRVAGLDAGADDYLVKPFALEELVARLRALLRRTTGSDRVPVQVAELRVDPARRQAWCRGQLLELTKREFELLCVLTANAGIVLARDRLLELVWGYDFATDTNVVDVFVGYLRRKLEADRAPRLIHTVRGVGFVLREDRG